MPDDSTRHVGTVLLPGTGSGHNRWIDILEKCHDFTVEDRLRLCCEIVKEREKTRRLQQEQQEITKRIAQVPDQDRHLTTMFFALPEEERLACFRRQSCCAACARRLEVLESVVDTNDSSTIVRALDAEEDSKYVVAADAVKEDDAHHRATIETVVATADAAGLMKGDLRAFANWAIATYQPSWQAKLRKGRGTGNIGQVVSFMRAVRDSYAAHRTAAKRVVAVLAPFHNGHPPATATWEHLTTFLDDERHHLSALMKVLRSPRSTYTTFGKRRRTSASRADVPPNPVVVHDNNEEPHLPLRCRLKLKVRSVVGAHHLSTSSPGPALAELARLQLPPGRADGTDRVNVAAWLRREALGDFTPDLLRRLLPDHADPASPGTCLAVTGLDDTPRWLWFETAETLRQRGLPCPINRVFMGPDRLFPWRRALRWYREVGNHDSPVDTWWTVLQPLALSRWVARLTPPVAYVRPPARLDILTQRRGPASLPGFTLTADPHSGWVTVRVDRVASHVGAWHRSLPLDVYLVAAAAMGEDGAWNDARDGPLLQHTDRNVPGSVAELQLLVDSLRWLMTVLAVTGVRSLVAVRERLRREPHHPSVLWGGEDTLQEWCTRSDLSLSLHLRLGAFHVHTPMPCHADATPVHDHLCATAMQRFCML